jgi:iron complex outermembrane receptor protein
VLQQALFWEVSPKHSLQYYGWQQRGQRNLPPTTTQARSEATQHDALHRHLLLWQARARNAVWESRLAYANERIHYQDPRQGIDSPSRFQSWVLQPKRSTALSDRLRNTIGAQWTFSRADIANYRGVRQLSQAGLYSQWIYAYAHGQIEAAVRLESNDWAKPIPVFNVAINRDLGRGVQVAAGGGRDFRTPSLNDLYWVPGGNPTLLPELAWSQFAALEWTCTGAVGRLHIRMHGYNRTVSNWIQWAQQDGNAYWSAANVAKVWSRGMEPRIAWERPLGRGQLNVWTQYFLTRSTHQTAILNPSIARGDQLWYTPVHRTASGVSYQRHHTTLRLVHHYTGPTVGTLAPLPHWHWAQVVVSSRHTWRRLAIEWHVEANNILNADYRIIERRPMPGRHFALGLKVGLR